MTRRESIRRGGTGRAAVRLSAIWLLVAATAGAQIPDAFENLEVLPKDIEQRQLVDMMKSFCRALDVSCTHCHAGEEGAPISEIDFASDEKQAKQVARVMMRMVDAINNTHLPKIGEDASSVQCVTCHRGQPKPRTLEEVLSAAVMEEGTEGALAKYRELRERYYGGATFDFTVSTLTRLAGQLAGDGKAAAAIAFLELNTELYPEEMMSYFFLGDLHAKNGDQSMAVKSLEKALEIEPKNPIVRRKLEQLKEN